jgi:ATP-dependent Clp protease protease subunit
MRNELEDLHREQEQLPTREIWVNDFNEEAVRQFHSKVTVMALNGPSFPIVVYIDSYGGYADSLMAMLDIMESFPNPFITVAVGKACSCGAILLSAGDYRYCGRNTRVMIHRSSAGSYGNMRNLTSDIKEMERVDHYVMDVFAKNCGLTGKDELFQIFKDRNADDLWMSADEAKFFGVIDHIGLPNVNPIVHWSCTVLPEKEPKPLKIAKKLKKTKTDNKKQKKK